MVVSFFSDFLHLLPQIFYFVVLLVGLSVFSAYNTFYRSSGRPAAVQISSFLAYNSLLLVVLLVPFFSFSYFGAFSNLVFSPALHFYTLLAAVGLFSTLYVHSFYSTYSDLNQFETPLFMSLVFLSTLVVFYSNDFLVAYLGLEFQALALYVLAASRVNSTYSTEAGLKYFVLGSFASCLLLLGVSFLYGLTGLTNFSDLGSYLLVPTETFNSQATLLSLLLIVLGLLFKVGAAPFHFWVPDVYTGAPIVITSFFAIVPKLAAWVLLLKLSLFCLQFYFDFFSNFFVAIGLLSLVVGAYGAVFQLSLKRILAFSAIAHTGYLLLSLASFQSTTFTAVLMYLSLYIVSLLPVFIILVLYFPKNTSSSAVESVYGLRYLYKHNPLLCLILVLSLFSLAGVPPFSGFFAKLYIFFVIVNSKLLYAAILALFLSSASAVYYLKIIRFSFFFKNFREFLLFNEITRPIAYLISTLFVLNISFFAWGSDFLLVLSQFHSSFVL
jgi:NADH-quinone oxidoreductase subunit N